MTFFTQWYLFPIYTSKHLVERVQFNVNCLYVFDMVHLNVALGVAVSAVLIHCTNCGDLSVLNSQGIFVGPVS